MIINKVVHGGPAYKVPGHLSFGQYVLDCLKENCKNGDSVALINGDTGEQLTYGEIWQETVNIATGLQKLGLKRGDVIALCSENRKEFMSAALGAICCGATITTLNLMYTEDEIIHALKISRPKLVFGSEIAFKRNLSIFKKIESVKYVVQLAGSPVDRDVLPLSRLSVPTDVRVYEPAVVQGSTDALLILYSSGTTGLPKGVVLTHLNVLYSAASFEAPEGEDEITLLSIVPWYHAYGLMSTYGYISVKKRVVFFSGGFNPEKYLEAIPKYKVRVLIAVPPIVVFLSKHPLVEKYDLSSVEMVWCGAAPLSKDTIDGALKRMPNCMGIFQAYGMTETSLAATKDSADQGAPLKPGSGGYPLNGVRVKVVDIETREKLDANQQGEICIKGPIIMNGYAGNEAASRDIIDEEGYLKTGDIGYYDADGCFFVVDRLKELIKYKGYQVAPAAVESVVLQHGGVAECGVVGAPDELAGELPTAFVVRKPGAQLTEQELRDFTDKKLSPSSRLYGGVIFVNEIPKNPSGKILRRVLKQKLLERVKSKL